MIPDLVEEILKTRRATKESKLIIDAVSPEGGLLGNEELVDPRRN